MMSALHHGGELVLHVVSQVVKAQFIVGAVGNICGVGGPAFRVGEAMQDTARGQPQKAVDLSHPLRVALGQIVIDGDDMNTLARQRVQVGCQRGHQGFTFAGLHLGNPAIVEHHAADQLDVVVTLAERALGCFADNRKSFRQQIVQFFPIFQAGAEFCGLSPQCVVRKRRYLRFQCVDYADAGFVGLQFAVVAGAKDPLGNCAKASHQEMSPCWGDGAGQDVLRRFARLPCNRPLRENCALDRAQMM